jgi:hypothetical protein
MRSPFVPTGVIQPRQPRGPRIKTGEIRALEGVVVEAAEGKVRRFGQAAMLARDNVVDLER